MFSLSLSLGRAVSLSFSMVRGNWRDAHANADADANADATCNLLFTAINEITVICGNVIYIIDM